MSEKQNKNLKRVNNKEENLDNDDKNFNILNNILDIAGFLKDIFNNVVSNNNLNLEEIAKQVGHKIDKIIIETEESENINFIGGKFIIKYIEEDDNINLLTELYFKNNKDEWFKRESNHIESINILDNISIKEIKRDKEIKYNIVHP